MKTYVITGGSSGIGAETVRILKNAGHEVCNLDIVGGDIFVNLKDKESRKAAITAVHERYPEGIDGLISNAGVVAGGPITAADVVSIDYFGSICVASGCFDLLKKKQGACVLTATGSVTFYKRERLDITEVLNNDGDEDRVRRLVDSFDQKAAAQQMYLVSKYALVRWMRRNAPSWCKAGVNLNAVAPGSCATKLTAGMPKEAFEQFVLGLPMPKYYDQKSFQDPLDVAKTMAFLVSEEACGISGQLVYCDGGTDSVVKQSGF